MSSSAGQREGTWGQSASEGGPLRLKHSLLGHNGKCTRALVSPGGHLVATVKGNEGITLWDTETGARLRELPDTRAGANLSFSVPGGELLAVSSVLSDTVHVWETATGRLLYKVKGQAADFQGSDSLHARSEGTLLTLTLGGRIDLWSAECGMSKASLRKIGANIGILTRDMRTLVLGSMLGGILLYDASSGNFLKSLKPAHKSLVNWVVEAPSSSLLASCSADLSILVWCTRTWKCLHVLFGHTGAVNMAAFSSAKSPLLATGSSDKSVRVWAPAWGRLLHQLWGHKGRVTAVGWASTGESDTRLLSASADKTVRMWDGASGHSLAVISGLVLPAILDQQSQAFGNPLATVTAGGEAELWEFDVLGQEQGREVRKDFLVTEPASEGEGSLDGVLMKVSALSVHSKAPAQPVLSLAVPMPDELLRSLAPNSGVPGVCFQVMGAVAQLDPYRIAPVLVNAIQAVDGMGGQVLVCKVQAARLRGRVQVMLPFVQAVRQAVEGTKQNEESSLIDSAPSLSEESLVQGLLPCVVRIYLAISAAKTLLQSLPQDRSAVVLFIKQLFQSTDLVKQFEGVNTILGEALQDIAHCVTLLQFSHTLVPEAGAWREPWREQEAQDRQAEMQQLTTQVMDAFGGRMDSLNAELAAARMDIQGFQAGLEAIGADTRGLLVEVKDAVKSAVAEAFEKYMTRSPSSSRDMPSFCIDVSEVVRDEGPALGSGGFGAVYRGKLHGYDVAVKVFHNAKGLNRVKRKKIFEEAYIMHKCAVWPGLVKLHGLVLDSTRSSELDMALVTELVEGPTLDEVLEDEEQEINSEQQLQWCIQAARTVRFLHLFPAPYGPIVHGDLKTNNMMLTSVNEGAACLKLIDFGCAKISHATKGLFGTTTTVAAESAGSKSSESDSAYSLLFAAPEILRDVEQKRLVQRTPATDVYALGMVFYEIFTRRVPFADRNWSAPEIHRAVLDQQRPAVAELESSNPGVAKLIEQCWEDEAGSRPHIEDICKCLEGLEEEMSGRGSVA